MKIITFVQLILLLLIILDISSVESQKTKNNTNKKKDKKDNEKEANKSELLIDELKKAQKKIDKQIKILESQTDNNLVSKGKLLKKDEKQIKKSYSKNIDKVNNKNNIKQKDEEKPGNKEKENERIAQKQKEREKMRYANKQKEQEIIKKQFALEAEEKKEMLSSKANGKGTKIINNKIKIFIKDDKNLADKSNPAVGQRGVSLSDTLSRGILNRKNPLDDLDNIKITSHPRNDFGSPNSNHDDYHTFTLFENGPGMSQRKVLKTETMEYNIPVINIDNSRRIDYYYPFFFRTKVLDYSQNLPINNLCNKCFDISCEYCNPNKIQVCQKCRHGFYLQMGKCFTRCPINYVADIYRGTCNPLDNTVSVSQISYLKAFTFGSCKNICGRESIDCSCERTCIYQGNCCSDYNECENLYFNNLNRNFECQSGNINCELCENFIHNKDPLFEGKLSPFKCGKCKGGFSLRYGECLPNCGINDKILVPNRICISTQKCLVESCAQCFDNNPSVCKTCFGGMFLYNNQCLASCPIGFRADRISMRCIEPQNYAWYWVFPSKSTCHNKCGIEMSLLDGMDCSCNVNCLQKGNCCEDLETFCPNSISRPSFVSLPRQPIISPFPITPSSSSVMNYPYSGTKPNPAIHTPNAFNDNYHENNINPHPTLITQNLLPPPPTNSTHTSPKFNSTNTSNSTSNNNLKEFDE